MSPREVAWERHLRSGQALCSPAVCGWGGSVREKERPPHPRHLPHPQAFPSPDGGRGQPWGRLCRLVKGDAHRGSPREAESTGMVGLGELAELG